MTTKNRRRRRDPLVSQAERCRSPSRNFTYAATGLALLISALSATGQTERVRLELVGQCVMTNHLFNIAAEGDYVCIVGVASGGAGEGVADVLEVINVRDKANPQRVGVYHFDTALSTPQNIGGALDIVVHGSHAYIARGDGLHIVDISSPASPHSVGRIEGIVGWLTISANHAYVAESEWTGSNSVGRLRVIDVSSPANPHQVGAYDTAGGVGKAAISGGYAYVGIDDERRRLVVLDISDPSNPVAVGSADCENPEGLGLGGCFSDGNHVFVVARHRWAARFFVVDVSTPTDPLLLGRSELFYVWQGMAEILGRNAGYLVVELRNIDGASLCFLDVSKPAEPVRVGAFDPFWSMAMSGDYVYAVETEPYLTSYLTYLRVYRISELPAITHQSITGNTLNLQWNEPARGMKLQRATSLANRHWQELIGSENTNAVSLPIWGGPEFFRLVKP